MAVIGKISGQMLKDNLLRYNTDLIIDGNLMYFDTNNRRVGILNNIPGNTLSVNGTVTLGCVYVTAGNITSLNGDLYLASIYGNVNLNNNRLTNLPTPLYPADAVTKSYVDTVSGTVEGNTIILGSNTTGQLVSNAVSLSTSTYITDGIARLNQVLGKLVPPAPGNFPNSGALSLTGLSTLGRMTNFTQTDNSGWGNLSVAAGTSVTSGIRTNTMTTNTFSRQGPGDSGNVQVIVNGVATGYRTMASGNNNNGTYGQLIITLNQDYSVLSGSAGGFWSSFSAQGSGSNATAGWNQVYLTDSAGANTNAVSWYYDNNTPGAPVWSNASIALISNSSTFSSTVPHLNSSSSWRLVGNVAKLSGDTYYTSDTFIVGSAGGAFQAPTSVTYTQAGVTTPLVRNAYVSSGSAYFTTTAAGVTGFGSSSTGPSMTAYNSYSTAAQTFSPGVTVLYKTGTSTQIEESSLTNALSTTVFRIVNPDGGTASDTPAFTGSESAFNSQTGPFYTTDATVVATVLKFDQTNYSSGYQPVGPNLSGQGAAQYFTFKFTKAALAKFNIQYSGTIAGLWVALPGISPTYSTLNGWYTMGTAYAGSGIPGAGGGGNGSNGCAVGGNAVFGSLVSNGSYTATFGTVNTSTAGNIGNEVYVRVKLTSGQSLTALSIQVATN
jgi:hypothetical protein